MIFFPEIRMSDFWMMPQTAWNIFCWNIRCDDDDDAIFMLLILDWHWNFMIFVFNKHHVYFRLSVYSNPIVPYSLGVTWCGEPLFSQQQKKREIVKISLFDKQQQKSMIRPKFEVQTIPSQCLIQSDQSKLLPTG